VSKIMLNSLRALTSAAFRSMTVNTTSVVGAVVTDSRFTAVIASVNVVASDNVGVKRAAASKQAILPPR